MPIRMNAALRRRLAASALGGLIAFAAIPAAMAQWLPPWGAVAAAGDIAQRLEAQGYQLIAPLQRRAGVYLADVRAGAAGFQRLVIDGRSGEILERFMTLPHGPGPEYAVRFNEFGEPPPGFAVQPPRPRIPGRPERRPGGEIRLWRTDESAHSERNQPVRVAGAGLGEAQAAARADRTQEPVADGYAASAAARSARGGEARRVSAARAQAEDRFCSWRDPERFDLDRANGA